MSSGRGPPLTGPPLTQDFRQIAENLVALHESEVEALSKENKQLKDELEALRRRTSSKDRPPAGAVSGERGGDQALAPPSQKLPNPDETGMQVELTESEDVVFQGSAPLSPTSRGSRQSWSSRRSIRKTLDWRARFAAFLTDHRCEGVIGILVVCNAVIMAVELQYNGLDTGYKLGWHDIEEPVERTWPSAPIVFLVLERCFTVIFTVEIITKILFLGESYFKEWLSYVDVVVVCVAVASWISESATIVNATAVRLLRLFKLLRFVRVVKIYKIMESLQLLLSSMSASVSTLFWSLVVLMVFQCIVGMTMCQILQGFMNDEGINKASREKVYKYYGTFIYALITMFEIHLANWSPACRVLIDEVSQWYGLAMVIYRCLAGFAVLNVINAVFIQRTMKVAQNTNEIMLVQKQRDQESYQRKLRDAFRVLDTSGDGRLSWEEVSTMMHQPEVKAWFSCLDMDAKDLHLLFELFDDGDGFIDRDEFLLGTSHLRGSAKNIDMARVMGQLGRVEGSLRHFTGPRQFGQIEQVHI